MNDRHAALETSVSPLASTHGVKALQHGREKLLADLKTLVDDAQALLKETADTSAESITAVPAYLENQFSVMKGNLDRMKSGIASKAKHATAVTHVYVQEHPWKSLGFVAAASMIVSILAASACASVMGKHTRVDHKT